ncbi:MAG: TonB-dependent receptor [Gemmatimonadetes bacterium]|nr:TonB-dependent receptor [Gemmatimonadota bacterium]
MGRVIQLASTSRAGWAAAWLVLCGTGTLPATAQTDSLGNRSQISGTVREAGTGVPVVNAQVQIVERRLRVLTGPDGRFGFAYVPPGSFTVRISRIGYELSVSQLVVGTEDVLLDLVLTPATLRLSDVVVTPGHFGVMDATVVRQQQSLTREDLETVPQLGEDVFRVLRTIPGVAMDDISTRLYVRGGLDQELLVLFDGMELYEPYHLKDFDAVLGIVEVQSVGGIDLLTGGFPANYGDKLTGVFDMRSRTPPIDGTRTALGLSIMNASLMSQGGFASGHGQWMFQARRGYLDIVLALTGSNDPDEDLSPKYFDVFGKVQYQLHANHRLSVSVLHAGDQLRFGDNTGRVDSDWTSTYGWLAWDTQLFRRVSARTMGFAGRLTRRRDGMLDEPGRIRGPDSLVVDDNRKFRFAGAKTEIEVELTDRAMIKFGLEAKSVEAEYDYFSAARRLVALPDGSIGNSHDTVAVDVDPTGTELGGYVAARVKPLDPFTAELGVRYDRISHTGDEDVAPRILAAWQLFPNTTLRGSWGRYFQSHGVHELDVGDGEEQFFNSDRAVQVALGVDHRFESDLTVRFELYRRSMEDQRPRFLNADRQIDVFPEAEGDRIRIDPGVGRAKGMEISLGRDRGARWGWSMNYALSVAEDEIDGVWVPRTLDQRHALGVNMIYRPNSKWQFSGTFQYHSGWPATESIFVVDSLPDGSLVLVREIGELNALRLPAYHRLDLRLTRNFSVGRGVLQAYVDIFNVYGRDNLRGYFFSVQVNDGVVTTRRLKGETLLPMLPSIGFRYEF